MHLLLDFGFCSQAFVGRVLIGGPASLNGCCKLGGKKLEEQSQGVAVGKAFVIVVQVRILVFPDDVAIPIQFQNSGGRTAYCLRSSGVLGRPGSKEKVATGQQISVTDTLVGLSLVANPALQVNQAGMVASIIGSEGVPPKTVLGSGINEPYRMMLRPTHFAPSGSRRLNQSQGEMRIRRIAGEPGRTDFNVRTGELYLAALTCPHHLGNVVPTLALV